MDLSNSLISLSNLILLSNESSIESCVLSIIFFPIFDLLIGFTIKLSPKSLIALIAPFDNFFTPESNPYSRCSTSQPSEYSFSIKSLPVKTLTATILFLFYSHHVNISLDSFISFALILLFPSAILLIRSRVA